MSIRLSAVIREWRRGSGKSLGVVSKEIGIPKSVLARAEAGETQAKPGAVNPRQSNGMDGNSLSKVIVWLLAEETTVQS